MTDGQQAAFKFLAAIWIVAALYGAACVSFLAFVFFKFRREIMDAEKSRVATSEAREYLEGKTK